MKYHQLKLCIECSTQNLRGMVLGHTKLSRYIPMLEQLLEGNETNQYKPISELNPMRIPKSVWKVEVP
ncbi:MAG: hypothetical protein QXR55_05360 [Sulfolobales archaeon]